MQILSDHQAPPSSTPAPPQSAPPTTTHTSAPATQLPTTGPSEAAQGGLAIGLALALCGAVILVVLKLRRARA